MILNGKAKETFNEWFFNYYNKDKISIAPFNHELMFEKLQELIQNAYIIEWFKSINILISIELDQTSYPKYQYRIVEYEHFGNFEDLKCDGLYSSKEMAEIEAIIEANGIFNSKTDN